MSLQLINVKVPTLEELAMGSSPRRGFYDSTETILFYGFVILPERLEGTVTALYRELVDSRPGPVTNGLATLFVSEALRDLCPNLGFRAVRRSSDKPTEMMIALGSNLRGQKQFSLGVDSVTELAEKFGMRPADAEWCFSNWAMSQYPDYVFEREGSSDDESTDDELTEESTDEPLTDHEEEVANMISIASLGEGEGEGEGEGRAPEGCEQN